MTEKSVLPELASNHLGVTSVDDRDSSKLH